MQLLEEIRAMPDGPVFHKAHKKQEIVWNKQQVFSGKQPSDLNAYPSAEEVKDAWMEGKIQAKAVAATLDMISMDLNEVCIEQPEDDMDNMLTEDEQSEVNIPTESYECIESCSAEVDSISARQSYRVNGGFKILRVSRLRKKGRSRGYIEYQMPVSFESADRNDIEVVGTLYQGAFGEMQRGP